MEDEKARRLISMMQQNLIEDCIASLERINNADLSDKNMLIRLILCQQAGDGDDGRPNIEQCAVDMWVDRAAYIDRNSMLLCATQAEQHVLWNISKNGQRPKRIEGTKHRITLNRIPSKNEPYIPITYLMVLCVKLHAMAFPEQRPDAKVAEYVDEDQMIQMSRFLKPLIEVLINGDESPPVVN